MRRVELNSSETIRQALRGSTAAAHERLDAAMAGVDLGDVAEYVRFLRTQLAAREPIEEWVAASAPVALQCPPQAALLRADLADLGEAADLESRTRFDAPADGALGVAWALGGSSLGNRAMLAGLRKRGADLPVRFLSDAALPGFFARLKRTIERPAADFPDLAAAIAGAHAVFAAFAREQDANSLRRAA